MVSSEEGTEGESTDQEDLNNTDHLELDDFGNPVNPERWLLDILERRGEEPESEEENEVVEMSDNLNTIEDPEQLRELVRQARQIGERKIIPRVDPPSLDNCQDYDVFKAKLTVWKATTGAAFTDGQQAGIIIAGIMDDHKHFKKGLQTDLMRTLTDEQLANPKMADVEDFLNKHLGGTKIEQIFTAYETFIQCEMKQGERYEDFVMRFDTAYKTLSQKDKDVAIPAKILAMQLMKAAKLDKNTTVAVRAGIDWDSTEVYNKTMEVMNKLCHGEVNRSSKVAQVKLVAEDGTYNVTRESGCLMVDGEKMIKQSEAQAFVSQSQRGKGDGRGRRPRRRGGRGGRGTGRGGAAAGVDEDTRECWLCGKTGHIQAKCPDNDPGTEHHEAELIGHQAWVLEVSKQDDHEQVILDDEEDWPEMEDSEENECFVGLEEKECETFTQEAAGAAALDSCCSRTLSGENWMKTYKKLMPKAMREQFRGPLESDVTFTFGDGKKLKSKGKYIIPIVIYGAKAKLVVETVPSDIPLLMSKTAMERCGIVLDFASKKVTAFGITRRMVETTLGHPIVGILPKEPLPFESDVMMVMGGIGEKAEEVLAVKDIRLGKRDSKKLTRQQQVDVIAKVHKQAGHQTKEKFDAFLKNSTIVWDKKLLNRELNKLTENCQGCILKKRRPDKPAACIPVADGFNQCVGIDLKIYGNGDVILYVIDMWSKLIMARFVKSKKSEDIIAALLEGWIAVYGCFDRTIHDNGGEFISAAFQEMVDLLGIQDGTSGAHSPWSCGVVEKHHAVVDATYEALRRDFPHYRKETLLQWAAYLKNSTPSVTGWSSYQILYGRNPKMPCLMTSNIAGLREEVITKELLENLNAMQAARIEYNRALADVRLKKMIKSKVRRNLTVFQPGDHVYWRTHNALQKWRQGKALAIDGKVIWIRAGSQIYRVSTDMVIKTNTEFDKGGELVEEPEETEKEKEDEPRRSRRVSFGIIETGGDGHNTDDQVNDDNGTDGHSGDNGTDGHNGDNGTDGHNSGDDAGTDGQDGPAAGGGDNLPDPSRQNYGNNEGALSGLEGSQSQVSPMPPGLAANSSFSGNQPDDIAEHNTEEHVDEDGDEEATSAEEFRQMLESPEPPVADRDARRAMIRTEIVEATQAKAKRNTSKTTKAAKLQARVDLKKNDVIIHDGQVCDVGDRLGKRGVVGREGKHYNSFNLFPRSGAKPYSIDLSKATYQKLDNNQQAGQVEQALVLAGEECHMDLVPFRLHGNQECMEAKRQELKKIVEDYKAVKVVPDDGHYVISSRFVIWYKKHSDGSIQTRARLVARGFEERSEVLADSPTMDSTSLKIILGVAQSKAWTVTTADVKAAFLQGLPLTERTVRVKPPPEAKIPAGHVWELQVALYGLQDASLRFHWKVCKVFKELGLKQSKLDPAVFYAYNKESGALEGVVGTHVDDFLMSGTEQWLAATTSKIAAKFELGKIEKDNFLYCGHRIIQKDGKLTLGQDEFAEKIKPFNISPARKRATADKVTDEERAQIRSGAGKLGWIARLTRPDLMFAQIEASSIVTKAEVGDLKNLNKAMAKVAETKSELCVPKLDGDVSKWRIQLFTDAAWHNLSQIGSTGGRVIFISDGQHSYAVHWASHRLRRVCHSSQTAEILAMNEGLNDMAFIREMLQEMCQVMIPAQLTIDCKNVYKVITGTTAPTDKRVRCEAAGVREALLEGEIEKINLVKGKAMLADVLTKRKVEPNGLLHIVQTGESLNKLGY